MQLRPGPFGHYPNHQGSAEKQRLDALTAVLEVYDELGP